MASSLRVNSIIPSSGTNVAIGTAGGSITYNANVTGVSTFTTVNATSLVGVATAGITTVYTNSLNGGQLGGSRNMIINGSMVVNQRGFTGAAGTTTNAAYVTDRFFIQHNHDGAVSAGQTSMNSTVGGAAYADGFQNALYFNVTTADASLSVNQFQQISQRIEGYNVQGIKKGTTNAQPVTVSFWVRSNTIGTYIVEVIDNDNTRAVSQAYTINVANTWEKKVLTFPADTTGVLDNDNAVSFQLSWWLAAGSTYSGGTLGTTWGSIVEANRAAGQTNLLASTGNNFWLTGVQLEVGDRATEFERRSYGQELQLCERYYQIKDFNGGPVNSYPGVVFGYFYIPLYPVMRSVPNVVTYDTSIANSGSIFMNSTFYAITYGTNATATSGGVSSYVQRVTGTFAAGEVCGHTYIRIRASAEL